MNPKLRESSWPGGLPIVTLRQDIPGAWNSHRVKGRKMAKSANVLELDNLLPISVQAVDKPETRYQGQLMGRVNETTLLINLQGVANFQVGTELIVRTLQEGKVLGFQTTITEAIKNPAELYFLRMPADIEMKNLRKSDRLNVFIPVELQMSINAASGSSDTVLFKGNMLNISGGGAQIYAKRKVPAESLVNLSFVLPGERRPNSLAGRVLDTHQQGSITGLRVMFFNNERNLQDLNDLRRWLDQNLEYGTL